MNEKFRQHLIRKTYLAITTTPTTPYPLSGEMIDFIVKNKGTNITQVVKHSVADAKKCLLNFKVFSALKTNPQYLFMEIEPKTGRSHQIRVQLSSRGFIILGDIKYGAHEAFDHAIALHAYKVHFSHPVTKEDMTICCPLPEHWLPFGLPSWTNEIAN